MLIEPYRYNGKATEIQRPMNADKWIQRIESIIDFFGKNWVTVSIKCVALAISHKNKISGIFEKFNLKRC